MNRITKFDRQLADMIWMVAMALRAGYSLTQVFEQRAIDTPEPTSSVCAQIVVELSSGLSLNQALTNWQ